MSQVKNLRTDIKFKDTPIGKIPVDWEVGPFSKIAEINPKRDLIKDNHYPFVEMAAISPDSHKVKYSTLRKYEGGGSRFQNRDTIFARITPCTENGKTAYIDFLKNNDVGFGSTEFIILGPTNNTDSRFVYYCAKWDKVRNIAISKMEGTSGRQRVPSRVFSEDIYVPLPPLPEQKKIAEILTTVDDAIGETDRIIEKTKELKKGLMQQLLTRGIGHKKFKQTEIGKIPVEWEVRSLDELMSVKHGYAFKSEYFGDEGPILLTPGNFTEYGGLYFNGRNLKRYSGDYPKEFALSPNDLVLVMTDLSPFCKILGNPALVPQGETILHNQRIGKIVLKSKKIDKSFLFYFFLSEMFKRVIKSTATGTTVRHTAPNRILNIKIALPNLYEQKKLAEMLNKVDLEIEDEERQKQKLETLKKSLMQVLLTGKVRVKLH